MKNSPINRFEQFNNSSVVVRDQSRCVSMLVSDRDIKSVTKTHVLFHIYEHWAEPGLSWTDLNGANSKRTTMVLLILLFFFCFFSFVRLFSIHLEWSTTCAAHWHRADAVTDCEEKKWVVPIARSRARSIKQQQQRQQAAIAEKSQEITNYLLNGRPRHIDSERQGKRERERLTDSQLTPSPITHTLSHINCILIIMNKPISDEEKN